MFSNHLIRSVATSSEEENLRLSSEDWHRVLAANAEFSESDDTWRGGIEWGEYVLRKSGLRARDLEFRNTLELCCGTGFLFFSFRELFRIGEESWFMDLSRSQLEAFRARCISAGIRTPGLLEGDIGCLPFPSQSLDLVYGNSFLHHLPDVGLCLREVRRVLRPGGMFIAFHEPNKTAPAFETFPRSLFKNVDLGSMTDIWLIRPETIDRIAKEAGFTSVACDATGLFETLVYRPVEVIRAKAGRTCTSSSFARLRRILNEFDRAIVPLKLRVKYGPSVCILATA